MTSSDLCLRVRPPILAPRDDVYLNNTLLLWTVYALDSVFKVNGFGGFGNYKAPSSLTSVSTRSPSECFLSLCVCVV